MLARAVIDASGTWTQPNPMGIDGLAVPGEAQASDRVAYGIPDVVGAARRDYAGKRVLVIGAGHSAINVALALMELQEEAPSTEIFWALRSTSVDKLLGGGLNDQLPERGALGLAAKAAMDNGRLKMLAPFAAEHVAKASDGLRISASLAGKPFSLLVDRIVVATGFRPDFSFLRELRVDVDPAVEAPPALTPLIDPNFHSCGTVPPHGIAELAHPEPNFTIVGSKSYGRAPTFLMATGYEQVRSVVASLAGDHKAAREVQLVLPETGVCSADHITGPAGAVAAAGCCGGPAPADVDACCVADAERKPRARRAAAAATRVRHEPGACRTGGVSMQKIPAAAVWGLGLTQIVGYGTIFYSFSILAPAMARDFGWPEQWMFGALSVSLLVSGMLAPTAGRLADRYGAARVMSVGSVAAALSLLACAGAPGPISFAAALVAMQIATCFIFYSTAFVVIVQLGDRGATRSITHLTLIAGFASTLFWPITTWLHAQLSWREVYVAVCVFEPGALPSDPSVVDAVARGPTPDLSRRLRRRLALRRSSIVPDKRTQAMVFALMLAGFAVEGLILSAVLIHMVPLMTTLGLGTAGLIVSTLFGPAQVASRFVNMLFGGRLPQRWLAVIAASLLPARPVRPADLEPLGAGRDRVRHPVRAGLWPDQHRRRHIAFGAVRPGRLRQPAWLGRRRSSVHLGAGAFRTVLDDRQDRCRRHAFIPDRYRRRRSGCLRRDRREGSQIRTGLQRRNRVRASA